MTLRGLMQHFNNRIIEVANALTMIGLGIQVIAAPVPSDYHALDMLSRWVSGSSIATVFIVVGAIRLAALVANGSWPKYGPWLRSLGALMGALIWSQMFLSLIAVNSDDLTSLGAPVYFVFTGVELLSIYRALAMRDRYGRGI